MTSDAGFDKWWRARYRKAAEKDPRDETIRRLRDEVRELRERFNVPDPDTSEAWHRRNGYGD